MDINIVPLNGGHLDGMEELERQCFSDPWSRKTLEVLLEDPHAYGLAAVDGAGTLLGYASLHVVLDEGHINNIAVHPAMRRQGVATALLLALRQYSLAQNLAFLTLEVRDSNLGAKALYAGQGFAEVGRRRGYYAHPKEDAIIMTLEFAT